jgi:hypothetical protein
MDQGYKKVAEGVLTGRPGSGICRIEVRVLEDDGTNARVMTEGPGIQVRAGQAFTVASSDLKDRNDLT